MKKVVVLVALLGLVLLLSPIRTDHILPLGNLTNGVLIWRGVNPVMAPSDETGGLLLETSDASGVATVTINGNTQVVVLTNALSVTRQTGKQRLWIAGRHLTPQARESLRRDVNLSIQVEVIPAPTNAIPVELQYKKRQRFFSRFAE